MGNESSAEVAKFTSEEIKLYQKKNEKMEYTIMTNSDTIRMLMVEKGQLTGTIEDLKTDIKKKDEDTEHRINDVCNSKKELELELHKYKSVPEFDAILNLNKDLVDFEIKIKDIIESNCEMLQTNGHDEEIEQMKQCNSELYGKLQKTSSMRALVVEKSAELKEAENEFIAKKEAARREFVKINAQLAQIKDKMGEATAKFAETVENSISELRKTLQAYQRKVIAIGNDVKTADSLIHEKMKNILLQQENAMMKEVIASNVGPSTNFGELPPSRFVNGTIKKKQLPRLDSDDSFSIVDDVSETCSLSGSTKPYKLILLNVLECEISEIPDKQTVCIVLRHLTNLSLDDIDVRRISESTMRPRPIVVSFDDIIYVHELLKYRFLLRNTVFSMIRICPYKSKPNATR